MKGLSSYFLFYLFCFFYPLFSKGAVFLPGEDRPQYTPSGPACVVSVSYRLSQPGEKSIITGDCWVWRPETDWVFKACESDSLCINPNSTGDVGPVDRDNQSHRKRGGVSSIDDFDHEEKFEHLRLMADLREAQINRSRKEMNQQAYNIVEKDIVNQLETQISNVPEEEWAQKVKEILEFSRIKSLLKDALKNLKNKEEFTNLYSKETFEQDMNYVAHSLTHSAQGLLLIEAEGLRYKKLEERQIEKIKNAVEYKNTNWPNAVQSILDETQAEIKNIIDRPLSVESWKRDPNQNPYSGYVNFSDLTISIHHEDKDESFSKHALDTEQKIYREARNLITQHIVERSNESLKTDIHSLEKRAFDALDLRDLAPALPEFQDEDVTEIYEDRVRDRVRDAFKIKHDRRHLGLLDDEKLNEPQEEPYVFISPEGEFLDKLQTLYTKLRQANPWHEQGLRAREVGLFAVETADEEFSEGNEDSAEAAYQIGETMADIALGVLPYIGAGKDAYELFTGLHLLTGRKLSPFERAMAMTGLTLSGLSGGTLSSGAIKLSLKKSGRVITGINNKLVSRSLRGMGAGVRRMAKDYPQAFFRALEGAQFQTKEQMQAALQFLKRAFSGENPSIESFTGALASAGKSGIEDFSKALDELSAFKPKLPIAGEEFLARSLRFKRELSNQIRYTVNKESLIAAGKIYARIFRSMKEVTGQIFEGQVWRGARTEYMKNPNNVFQFHKGMDSRIARYTIAERAVYTSLKEETTIKELAQQADVPLSEVRKLFVIASKGVKTDNILDLNNPQVLKQLNISEEAITKGIKGNPKAYELSQIIGHSAQKKGFKGILTPAAVEGGGKNLILFSELP